MYPIDNALLYEDLVDPNILKDSENKYLKGKLGANPKTQSSWCAGSNSTDEWIQVSLPNTQYWQGIKISGNPLLGAYVTNLTVYVSDEDGSQKNFIPAGEVRDKTNGT